MSSNRPGKPDSSPPNPAAVAMGRQRMAKLTSEQRTDLAKRAARARWPVPPERCPNTFQASRYQDVAHCELPDNHVGECVWDNRPQR